MADVRLRFRQMDEPGEVSCQTIDEAISLAAAQVESGSAWPVEVVVDGHVTVREPELVELVRQRLGEDDEEERR